MRLVEINLFFCESCVTVTARSEETKLAGDQESLMLFCVHCNRDVKHRPVAIKIPGPMQHVKFVTRER